MEEQIKQTIIIIENQLDNLRKLLNFNNVNTFNNVETSEPVNTVEPVDNIIESINIDTETNVDTETELTLLKVLKDKKQEYVKTKCNVCDVEFLRNNIKQHNNSKKHQINLSKNLSIVKK